MSSRLGEPISPERDDLSLKMKTLRMSESSSRNLGQLLLFSLRRDKLTWARIPVLSIVHICISHTFNPKQHNKVFHVTTIAHKPYKHEAKLKIDRYSKNTKNPSFTYLLSRVKLEEDFLDTDSGGSSTLRTNSAAVEHEHKGKNEPIRMTQDRNRAIGMEKEEKGGV